MRPADVTRPIQRTGLTQMTTYLLEDKSDSSVALAISQLLLKRVRVRLSPCRRSALRYVTEPRKKVLACSYTRARARARVCVHGRACVSVSIIQQTRVTYLFYMRHFVFYISEKQRVSGLLENAKRERPPPPHPPRRFIGESSR